MEKNILFIRLENGIDIVSRVIDSSEVFILRHPLQIVYDLPEYSETTNAAIALLPWIPTTIVDPNQGFALSKSKVLTTAKPSEKILAYYARVSDLLEAFDDPEKMKEKVQQVLERLAESREESGANNIVSFDKSKLN
jgi:hypothetical protein